MDMTPRQVTAVIAASGLDKGQFAERLGVSLRTVYRWTTGDAVVRPAFVALIEKTFPQTRKVLR